MAVTSGRSSTSRSLARTWTRRRSFTTPTALAATIFSSWPNLRIRRTRSFASACPACEAKSFPTTRGEVSRKIFELPIRRLPHRSRAVRGDALAGRAANRNTQTLNAKDAENTFPLRHLRDLRVETVSCVATNFLFIGRISDSCNRRGGGALSKRSSAVGKPPLPWECRKLSCAPRVKVRRP